MSLRHAPTIGWPEVAFFRAEGVLGERRNGEILRWGLIAPPAEPVRETRVQCPAFEAAWTEAAYLETVQALQEHIRAGDVYEINLTQVFASLGAVLEPLAVFEALVRVTAMPMAALFRFGEQWVISASPERFLRLQDGWLTTQPIKGTARRHDDPDSDSLARITLEQGLKERAENVMIVDLARNDLYRVCHPESVEVPGLFEVQSFARLHHLVSTVQGKPVPEASYSDILRATFPPGSMTGAPKVAAMQLIDRYERAARGAYSGALGYFSPDGTFDLSVVIRSLVYDAEQALAQYSVGGAITYDSDPTAEYREMLLKAEGLQAALNALMGTQR